MDVGCAPVLDPKPTCVLPLQHRQAASFCVSSDIAVTGRCPEAPSLRSCHTVLLPSTSVAPFPNISCVAGPPRFVPTRLGPSDGLSLVGAQAGAQGGWRPPASRPVLSPTGVHLHGHPALHEAVRAAPAGDELAEGRRGHRAGQCGQALGSPPGDGPWTRRGHPGGWRGLACAVSRASFCRLAESCAAVRGLTKVCKRRLLRSSHLEARRQCPFGGHVGFDPVGSPSEGLSETRFSRVSRDGS